MKDLATGDLTLASTSDAGVKGDEDSFNPSLSKAGTRVAFQSSATNLDPGDTDPSIDIYVKKLTFGDIVLVSTSTAGVKGDGGSLFPSIAPLGKRVAFTTSARQPGPGRHRHRQRRLREGAGDRHPAARLRLEGGREGERPQHEAVALVQPVRRWRSAATPTTWGRATRTS